MYDRLFLNLIFTIEDHTGFFHGAYNLFMYHAIQDFVAVPLVFYHNSYTTSVRAVTRSKDAG